MTDDNPSNKEQEEIGRLKNPLEEQARLAEERLEQLKYLQADFDNYRKNFEKEKQLIIKKANEDIIKELLSVIDGLEKALETEALERDGLTMIYKNFLKVLEKYGMKNIEATGQKFDPHFHEAVAKEISDEDEGTILEEIQKGFLLHSKILRPSKVKISAGKENG